MRKQSWRDYRIWSASSFAIVVLVCAHLESFGFGATGLLALLVIGAAASGLLSALYALLRGSQAWRIVGLHLFGVPLLASMLGGSLLVTSSAGALSAAITLLLPLRRIIRYPVSIRVRFQNWSLITCPPSREARWAYFSGFLSITAATYARGTPWPSPCPLG